MSRKALPKDWTIELATNLEHHTCHPPFFSCTLVTCFRWHRAWDLLFIMDHKHFLKSVRVWRFSGPYVPAFNCGKIRARKTLNTDTFHTVKFQRPQEGLNYKHLTYNVVGLLSRPYGDHFDQVITFSDLRNLLSIIKLEAVAQKFSIKKYVLRNSAEFTGKHMYQSLLFSQELQRY